MPAETLEQTCPRCNAVTPVQAEATGYRCPACSQMWLIRECENCKEWQFVEERDEHTWTCQDCDHWNRTPKASITSPTASSLRHMVENQPAWKIAVSAVAIIAVGIVAGVWVLHSNLLNKKLDGNAIAQDITTSMQTKLSALGLDGSHISVMCPSSVPQRSGYIFDCSMVGYPENLYFNVRVTEDDSSGHYHYEGY